MSGRSRSRTPSARARGAAALAAKAAKGARITAREKEDDKTRCRIRNQSADQSGVRAGYVRVDCFSANPLTYFTKVVERVAPKHAANGTQLRPFQRVFRGNAYRTPGGLHQADLMRWKGRIVSKRAHETGMAAYKAMSPEAKAAWKSQTKAQRAAGRRKYSAGGRPAGDEEDDSESDGYASE